ncbi:hypothetical protein J4205_01630 [Candidatus Pacearchaeota archaeon]|nr:hypothetical protein [Candidatus Pacearchaeota archaeon]
MEKNVEDFHEALGIIYDSIKEEKLNWHLNGSFNLLVQGVDIKARDLDIETDEKGSGIFKEKLKEFLQEDNYKDDIKAHSLVFDIEGVEVEVLAHDDQELSMINEHKMIKVDDMDIPVLPLEKAWKFYKIIGKDDKAEIVSKHLKLFKEMF